jgi:hypothetical protein
MSDHPKDTHGRVAERKLNAIVSKCRTWVQETGMTPGGRDPTAALATQGGRSNTHPRAAALIRLAV